MCDSRKNLSYEMDHGVDWAVIVRKMNETDIDVIDVLNNTNPDAKEEFLSNKELSKPHNIYGKLGIKQVEQNIDTIISLQKELKLSKIPEKKRLLADLVLESNLKKNRFVQAN